jgi:hypothetical protein
MPKIFQDALGGKRLPKFGKILEGELAFICPPAPGHSVERGACVIHPDRLDK